MAHTHTHTHTAAACRTLTWPAKLCVCVCVCGGVHRDNCCCLDCLDGSTLQRTFDTASLDLEVAPEAVSVPEASDEIEVTWPATDASPRHHSVYSSQWLRQRAYWFAADSTGDSVDSSDSSSSDTPRRKSFVWQGSSWDTNRFGDAEELARARAARRPLPLPSVPYEQVIATDDSGVHMWLQLLRHYGFAFVQGVPQTVEATKAVSE